MFEFLRIQFKLGKVGGPELEQAVAKGWITEEQKNTIIEGA